MDIASAPSPFNDLVSTYKLYQLFRTQRYDIIHSTTPKAGLLCAIAGFLAKTPIRMHSFTGQTWATKTGLSKLILRSLDGLIVWLNSQCYADSLSQRDYLVEQHVGNEDSIKVIGDGSLAGVDLARFNPDLWKEQRHHTQKELNILPSEFVILFIGRLSKEKGVYELISAFLALYNKANNAQLILLGPCEEAAVGEQLAEWTEHPNIQYLGKTSLPEKYLSISDILCLPSHREGFGTVVIEAAAMKIPTLGTEITGLTDAVDNGVTGILTPKENITQLYEAMLLLMSNPTLCKKMGNAAYERTHKIFDSAEVSRLVNEEYQTLASKYKAD